MPSVGKCKKVPRTELRAQITRLSQENARLKRSNSVLRMSLDDLKMMHQSQCNYRLKEWQKTLDSMFQKRKQSIIQHSLCLQSIALKLKQQISEIQSASHPQALSPSVRNDELSLPLTQLIQSQFQRLNVEIGKLKQSHDDQRTSSLSELKTLQFEMDGMRRKDQQKGLEVARLEVMLTEQTAKINALQQELDMQRKEKWRRIFDCDYNVTDISLSASVRPQIIHRTVGCDPSCHRKRKRRRTEMETVSCGNVESLRIADLMDTEWQCTRCTFINMNSSNSCEICGCRGTTRCS